MFKKVWSLASGLYASVRRLRSEKTPLRRALVAALRALRMGPRAFVHRLMAYASGAGTAPPVASDYMRWLAAQPVLETPSGAGRVSIVMPVCNTPEQFLLEAIGSVEAQTYPDWELCIHDDASDQPHVRRILDGLAARSPRFKVSRSATRGGIAAATNAAVEAAEGRWIAFLDHDDLLEPDALAAVVACHQRTEVDIVYTDHDILGDDGQLRHPYFKPDWNHDLFLSQMYLAHLVSVKRSTVEAAGGLRSDCDGSQDYDLILRCLAAGARVGHVPKVLYHWRAHAGSTAASAGSKPYAHDAGKRALQHHVDTLHPGARVDDGKHLFCYDVRYPYAATSPLTSIIIPTRDGLALLRVAVSTLLQNTRYAAFEIIIVDNGSVEPDTLQWLAEMSRRDDVRVVHADIPFNWSQLNNIGAREARGEVLVFLNNDTEVTDGAWLERLVENALRPEVGVCGPMLLYGDGSIQHAGVVVGMGGWADHVFKGERAVHAQNLFVSPLMRRQVLAVTGACMAIERRKFDALGGFDESFVVCGSDVELCLRAFAKGYANVYLPEARMIHHESKTRDPRAIPEGDFVRSAEAYSPYRETGDPFYNPNLDYGASSPRLRNPA